MQSNTQSHVVRSVMLLVVATVLALVVAVAALTGYLTVPSAGAQTEVTAASAITRSITVVGAGKISVSPDVARVQIGIETMRKSVQEASAENRQRLDAVLDALRAEGVADNDIQTSGFSVYAERYGPEGPLADDDVNYRVSNSVRIVVRDLEQVGSVLDAAIDAGANNIYGVEFALDDVTAMQSEVRAEAVADARERAADLAQLNGVQVGRVLSISEVVGGGMYGPFEGRMMGMGAGDATSIMPGELDITLQLQVVYELVD